MLPDAAHADLLSGIFVWRPDRLWQHRGGWRENEVVRNCIANKLAPTGRAAVRI